MEGRTKSGGVRRAEGAAVQREPGESGCGVPCPALGAFRGEGGGAAEYRRRSDAEVRFHLGETHVVLELKETLLERERQAREDLKDQQG